MRVLLLGDRNLKEVVTPLGNGYKFSVNILLLYSSSDI